MTQDDEGRRQDRLALELQNEAVALELPDLRRHGVHLVKRVATTDRQKQEIKHDFGGFGGDMHPKTAMRRYDSLEDGDEEV